MSSFEHQSGTSRPHRTAGQRTFLGATALAIAVSAFGVGAVAGRTELAPSAPAAVIESTAGTADLVQTPNVASPDVRSSYADLVAKVAPSVVTIRSERLIHPTAQQLPFGDDQLFRRFFGDPGERARPRDRRVGGLGSGVIVSDAGYILTNHHVVEGATKVQVELSDRRSLEAKVVGSDQPSDLAVLKVDGSQLPSLRLGDSDAARVGDVVLAFGNPLGVGQTVTMGIISAKSRATGLGDGSFEDFIQTDAAINQGNSGGALVNLRGDVVGINSQILSPSGGNIGIGFAIPANLARGVMDQLIEHGKVRRGLLGVTVQNVTSDMAQSLGLAQVRGAIVSGVTENGPAAKAGVRQGDVIVSLDGAAVTDSNSLRNTIARTAPNSTVALTVVRDGQEHQLRATLSELSAQPGDDEDAGEGVREGGRYGMTLEPLTPELARQLRLRRSEGGVVVRDIDDGGVAAGSGIARGDVILEVNRQKVESAEAVRSALQQSTDKPALVLVQRGDATLYLTLQHPKG